MFRDDFSKVAFRGDGCCDVLLLGSSAPTQAYEILGTGTGALLGNDLTDIGDDGDPEADFGYDAFFDSSDEPGFGGGEFAFNVFDNILGPGNDKWCCGVAGGIFDDEPIWVSAEFPRPYRLTHFTVSSANDVPGRDPLFWSVQGSNNGEDYTDIYTYDDDIPVWDDRLQVALFSAGDDFPVQGENQAYTYFRFATFNTLNNPNGAYFQVGELEFFGESEGNVEPSFFVGGEGTIGTRPFSGNTSNKVYGPATVGPAGWNVNMAIDRGVTLGNLSVAERVLDETIAAGEAINGEDDYDVIDLAGGTGSFFEDLPYPNGVNDASQNDFAVRAEASVVIPVGTWTIGFGSDDGGQITIPGVEFTESVNNDSTSTDQISYAAPRGHAWTVGTFVVTGEPLETTIEASFYERGGGDDFEIAIIDEESVDAASPDLGWELLGDGTLGWAVNELQRDIVSIDLTATVADALPYEFDVNGDSGAADQFVLDNANPNLYIGTLDIDGVTIRVNPTGAVASGESFDIIDAQNIVGTPTITSTVAGQVWDFDPITGSVCLDFCSNTGFPTLDQINALLVRVRTGTATKDDIVSLIEGPTFIGDSNLDGEFNSADFVQLFTAGQYEDAIEDNSAWETGDWDGNGDFDSADFVFAFTSGGYEMGPRAGTAAAAVPEPSSIVLLLIGGLMMIRRRK